MAHTVVSSKFQIVIPKEIRQRLALEKGQVLQIVARHGVISLVPEVPLAELRGFAAGIDTGGLRDKEDRL